jgi:hypothetical protein
MTCPDRDAARASELVKLGLSFNGLIYIFENSSGPGIVVGTKTGIRAGRACARRVQDQNTATSDGSWVGLSGVTGKFGRNLPARGAPGQLTLAGAFFIHPPQP